MKLKHYNRRSVTAHQRHEPAVRFSKKGVVTINAKAAEMTGLQVGDCVELIENEDEGDFYIAKSTSEWGFSLRGYKYNKQLMFNNTVVCKQMFHYAGSQEASSVSFRLSREPVRFQEYNMYLLIKQTAHVLSDKKKAFNDGYDL